MRFIENVDTAAPLSVIGLGTWQFGSREWGYGGGYDDGEAGRIVARARELGVTVYDTAELYGFGRSETILGRALAATGGTAGLTVASKIFPVFPVASVVRRHGLASAKRLGIPTMDLYQVHQPNPVVRDGTTMRGMRQLRDLGVVRDVGVSNYSLSRWRVAEERLGSRVLSNQVQFSLVHRNPLDDGMLRWAEQTGHLVIAWSPLAQGLLSGRYDRENRPTNGIRSANPLFLPENIDAATPLIDTLREVAAAHGATPSQIALAWVVHPPNVIAIPGASSVAQVESNVAAADIRLGDDEYAALTAAAEAFRPITGARAVPKMISARRNR
ncbi:MAG: aldo/keto reductase [Actinobacteria bacterium]|nr:aldo/keto reductase [Actinomycetota bacterium]